MNAALEDDDLMRYGVNNIDYVLEDFSIDREGNYSASLQIECVCSNTDSNFDNTSRSLVAYAIEDHIPGRFETYETSQGEKVFCCGKNINDKEKYGKVLAVITVNNVKIHEYGKNLDLKPSNNTGNVYGGGDLQKKQQDWNKKANDYYNEKGWRNKDPWGFDYDPVY